jgi:uncharacterized protein
MTGTILTALGLVCVIEGLTYALVPAQLKRMMASMQNISNEHMRLAGTIVLAIGVGVVWMARSFLNT